MEEYNIVVRQESPTDFPSVYSVNTAAFKRSEEAQLVDRLRSSNSFIPELSLVAVIDKDIVGYILFTQVSIIGKNSSDQSLALAPISVHPKWQQKGVGTTLIRNGLDVARNLDYKSVIVLGHADYYHRFGFRPTNKWGIKPPFKVSEALFMGLELIENAFANLEGTVIYSKEFAIV